MLVLKSAWRYNKQCLSKFKYLLIFLHRRAQGKSISNSCDHSHQYHNEIIRSKLLLPNIFTSKPNQQQNSSTITNTNDVYYFQSCRLPCMSQFFNLFWLLYCIYKLKYIINIIKN